jgi:hypothetical protein
MRCLHWPWWRRSGATLLLLVLMVGGICACSHTAGRSPFRVQIPLLTQAPAEYVAGGVAYRCYVREDSVALVRELKAACLALGGSREECQAE